MSKDDYLLDLVVRNVHIIERYWRPRDLLQDVVVQEDAADTDQVTQSSSLDNTDAVVRQVHVKQCRDLAKSK